MKKETGNNANQNGQGKATNGVDSKVGVYSIPKYEFENKGTDEKPKEETKRDELSNTVITTAPSVTSQIDKYKKLGNLINERNQNAEALNRLNAMQIVDTPNEKSPQNIVINDSSGATIAIKKPEFIRQIIDLLRNASTEKIAAIDKAMVDVG